MADRQLAAELISLCTSIVVCHKKKEIAMLLCYYKILATSQLELGFSLQCQGTFEISFFLL